MTYTDIYPIYDKMKEDGHVIFHQGGEEHLCVNDYYHLKVTPIIEKLKHDIEQMVSFRDRTTDIYVGIGKDNVLSTVNAAPNAQTYLFIIKFEGYKYLLARSKDLYILMNYVPDGTDICMLDADNRWDILPRGGRCRRTIFQLNQQYAKYVVNTYTAFTSFCQNHIGLARNQMQFDNNKNFRNALTELLTQIVFPEGESDCYYSGKVDNKDVYVRLIKIYNVIIVADWQED